VIEQLMERIRSLEGEVETLRKALDGEKVKEERP
jgi:DNA-binding FrmR family transcriptional regulator